MSKEQTQTKNWAQQDLAATFTENKAPAAAKADTPKEWGAAVQAPKLEKKAV
ncbi:MAG: hypothetical protein ACQEQL_05165 [Pseudomonadota bacterium]